MGAYSGRIATSAAGAPIGQLDLKPLRHFRYTRRRGVGVFRRTGNVALMNIPVTQDIAEDLAFRVAIRQSEIRYRRLFEAAHDGVLILDSVSRKITDANPFMSQLLGYRHEELLGKELWEIGLLKDEQASQAAFRELQKAVRSATKICRWNPNRARSGKLKSWPTATMRTARRSFSAISATSPSESGPKLRCARAKNAFALCSNWAPRPSMPAMPRGHSGFQPACCGIVGPYTGARG